MAQVKTFGERIADALVEDGLLFTKQVEELLEKQKKEGTRLLKLIVDKGLVTDQDMSVSMGRVLNTPPINLFRMTISPEIAELLPRDICHNHKVVPVSRLENKLFLAHHQDGCHPYDRLGKVDHGKTPCHRQRQDRHHGGHHQCLERPGRGG
jgi:hypothetical protein